MGVIFDDVDLPNGAMGLITPMDVSLLGSRGFDSGVHDTAICVSRKACLHPQGEEIVS